MSLSDVYDYTDKLKLNLAKNHNVADVSLKFKKINENPEKVKFLENLLKENDLLGDKGKLKLTRSNAIAESCKLKGNQFYSKKQFVDSLECYNQTLCFAEPGSKDIGIAYANRSAIYYELKMFELSLENIEKARKNNYPEELSEKLNRREKSCLEMINNGVKDPSAIAVGADYLKLKYKPNEKLPFIADCLNLQSDEEFGRYITTSRNLRPGDVVCVEEPFTKLLLPPQRFKYCATCLNDNFLDLFPCAMCTSTMYCSKDCEEIGLKKFHRFECVVIDRLNTLATKILRIALRTFFEALYVCDGDLQELKKVIDENSSTTTIFDFESPSKIDELRAIDALATNESMRFQADLFQRSGIVAIICNLMIEHTELKEVLVNDDDRDFFRNFLFKQTQIAACNYHGLFNGVMKKSEQESNPQYGSASFPFCSLINHSCAPNVVRVTYDGKNHIVVNRPIAAGDQIFDNYGFHHCLEKRAERRASLFKQYMFQCGCEACKDDLPLFFELQNIDKNFKTYLGDDIDVLMELDVKRAKDRFESYCNYLQKKDRNYPCFEISSVQECLLRCFTIFVMSEFKLKLCQMNSE